MKIAIAGAGKLGLRLADILTGGDHSITLIDKDVDLVQRLSASYDVATVAGNAKEASLLEEIGIDSYDYFIAATDRDEKNIVIGALAKRLGVKKVIVRVRDPEHNDQEELLKDIFGIDLIINPDYSIAEEINKYLIEKYTIRGGILHAGKVSLLEITIDTKPELIGTPVSHTREKMRLAEMSLAAISKNGKVIILGDEEDLIIEEDDVLYVVGNREQIDGAAAKLDIGERYTDIQRVMIAGGGKSGFYLARMLEEFGASVKIIEIDNERCQYLAANLQNALVLNGDATDTDLLTEEGFSGMDAFVSATGYDEENLLLALMAKQDGIEDVIAKISRESYGSLITSMGVDMVLNPVDISASHIARYIKDETIISSQIIQGQAEFVRIKVSRDMSAKGKVIESLRLPSGLAIVAIQRGLEVILPDDDTRIAEGDHIVILSLLSESFDLEKLLKVRQGLFK